MKKILFDSRWDGQHGIGRFSREVSARIAHCEYKSSISPYSPVDPFVLSAALVSYAKNCIYFSPGYNGPFFSIGRYVVTIHDLNHIDRTENSSFLKRIYYRFILRRVCLNAAAIFTVSQFSRDRIMEWAGISGDNLFVVGNGVSSRFSPFGNGSDLNFSYVLCVSNRKGHKNEKGALLGFLKANLPNEVKLVFTGEPDDFIANTIDELDALDRVHFTGRVSEEELAALYRSAILLLFPSFYEGFGLPIIEAFASGTPVITSDITSMPEIAGDAALLVDPYNVDEISQAVQKMYFSAQLREECIRKGFMRVADYSWDAVAERVSSVFDNLNHSRDRE